MERKEILVVVKTIPTSSSKYYETVCTAGITKDGQWIRIYPVKFRLLNDSKQYRKYDWISVEVDSRNPSDDFRKESYRCNQETIQVLDHVKPENNWAERKRICIDSQKVYSKFSELEQDSATDTPNFISLAVFKPSQILRVIVRDKDERDVQNELDRQERIKNEHSQDMFEGAAYATFMQARPMDVVFNYEFVDGNQKKHSLMIEDWEIYELYRKTLRYGKDGAIKKVIEKYEGFIKNNDLYFFLGTRNSAHRRNWPNKWEIIGVFYPKKEKISNIQQLQLF